MIKLINSITIISLSLLSLVVFSTQLSISTVSAADIQCQSGQVQIGNACSTPISVSPLPHSSTDSSQIKTILDMLFAIIGAISLLIITLAGFRYIVSRGESAEIAGAKNAIIYALIGLVVAILAFTIVNFVVGSL